MVPRRESISELGGSRLGEQRMLRVSRSLGESLLFDGEWLLTLCGADSEIVNLCVTSRFDPDSVRSIVLRHGESVEAIPEVQITILNTEFLRALLGIELPPAMSLFRKEVFDTIHGE